MHGVFQIYTLWIIHVTLVSNGVTDSWSMRMELDIQKSMIEKKTKDLY